jgi:hypothetical protein
MNKKYGIITLAIIGLLASGGAAYALMGNGFWQSDAIQQALEAKDYEAWKEAMMAELTEDQFNQLVEWYEQRQSRHQYMEQVRAAIEAGDYDAWKAAMEQIEKPQLTDLINEDNFDIFVAMHNAKQAGDMETAMQLREQLGISHGMGMHKCGMHGGMRPGLITQGCGCGG